MVMWRRIEPLLHGKDSDRGVAAKDNRLFVEAVLWIARTGAPWRDLPDEFGRWHTVYMRYNRWSKKGVWQQIFDTLADDPDLEQQGSGIASRGIAAQLNADGPVAGRIPGG